MQTSVTLIGCSLKVVVQSALTNRGPREDSDGWRHTPRLQGPTTCNMNDSAQPVFCLRIPCFVIRLEGLRSPTLEMFWMYIATEPREGCLVGLRDWP